MHDYNMDGVTAWPATWYVYKSPSHPTIDKQLLTGAMGDLRVAAFMMDTRDWREWEGGGVGEGEEGGEENNAILKQTLIIIIYNFLIWNMGNFTTETSHW